MDATFSVDDLRDAARMARDCPVMGHAVTLARWIGAGHRPVTPGQVLRKADVQIAGAVLGVDVPPKLRTMTDIPALRRPWWEAVGAGLLQVGDGQVTGGPALEHWPPGDADLLAGWLAVEAAAAALEERGPDEALSRVWESLPAADLDERLAQVQATGHPDADALARAVAQFAVSGAPLSIDQVAELKVSLMDFRPPIWRRVRLPVTATLADLHVVIQVMFGWDGDHLHMFQVGKKQYSGPFVHLEETGYDDEIRVRDATSARKKFTYTYDLGTEWRHEITLEKTLARDPGQDYALCVAFRGDSPVEYWSEDDPAEPEPFDLADVNRKLAALAEQDPPS